MENFFKKKPKPSTTNSPEYSNNTLKASNSANENINSIENSTSVNIPENSLNVQCQNISNAASDVSSNVNSKEPKDISRKGEEKKNQNFENYAFKKHADGRSFQSSWLTKFSWLEYSKEKDAAFCYACRQFGSANMSDVFTTTGYDKWQAALSAGKGFKKHESTSSHTNNMLSWKEKMSRSNNSQQVSYLLNETVLEKRRYYFNAIVSTIIFLAENELPFRGDWCNEENHEVGLFQNLFKFSLVKDEHLRRCQEVMPSNATYTSPNIQNEIIQAIADVLREMIVNEINESTYCTLMADGTKDKNGREIISIAFRYLKKGKAVETLLAFVKADDITAKGITDLIIDQITKHDIVTDKIICQCYDGASVMSGKHGGVQALVQEFLNKKVPYVHCFNHRLHLVVIAVATEVESCRLFFDQVRLLHKFFNRFKIRREYEGTNIPRLIETRWSGHLKAIQSIVKNYDELLNALIKIKNENGINLDADDIALASGLESAITEKKFLFMLQFLNELLSLIEPANKILQSRDVGFPQAKPIIEAVYESILALRTNDSFHRFMQLTEKLMINFENEELVAKPQRIRQRSSRLTGSIVMETLGERNIEMEAQTEVEKETMLVKSQYFEVIDRVSSEMICRFQENSNILTAITEINNIERDDFDHDALEPLIEINLTLPSVAELTVVKQFLSKNENKQGYSVLQNLFPVREAVKDTYHILEAAEVFGSSTAIAECSFSALSRIDTVRRMAMTDRRLCNLTFLAFEKNKLKNLDQNSIIQKFTQKNRRIQLL